MKLIMLLALWLVPVAVSIYGIVLSFHASVVLGVVALLLSPMGTIVGAVELLTNIDLAQRIATALGL